MRDTLLPWHAKATNLYHYQQNVCKFSRSSTGIGRLLSNTGICYCFSQEVYSVGSDFSLKFFNCGQTIKISDSGVTSTNVNGLLFEIYAINNKQSIYKITMVFSSLKSLACVKDLHNRKQKETNNSELTLEVIIMDAISIYEEKYIHMQKQIQKNIKKWKKKQTNTLPAP